LNETVRIAEEIKDAVDGFELGQPVEELKKIIEEIIKGNEYYLKPAYESFKKVSSLDPVSSKMSLGPGITDSPAVSQQVVSLNNPLAGMIQGTGLTASENALLSNEEKAIRMRQKGIS
jgi:hypothetical protein